MRSARLRVSPIAAAILLISAGCLPFNAASHPPRITKLSLDSLDGVEFVNAKPEIVTYRGKRCLRLVRLHQEDNESLLAILNQEDFKDGTIEAVIAGMPRPDAPPDMRGFVGIAFHVQSGGARFEDIFLRPANGRAGDQLRRNHSTQYQSLPLFPWNRLRAENPGVYESYVDLELGAWTKVTIQVSGKHARLWVNDASQPCLVVNDLKLGEVGGKVAFWAHFTSDAYLASLTVRK